MVRMGYRESQSSKVLKMKTVWHILLEIGVVVTYISTRFIWIACFYFAIIFKNYLNTSLKKFTFVKYRLSTWHFLVDSRTFIDMTQFIKYFSSNIINLINYDIANTLPTISYLCV